MPAVAPPAPLPGHGGDPDAQTAGHGLTRVLSFRSPSGWRDQMTAFIGRREFITLLGGAAAWPLAARAQRQALPVVGHLDLLPGPEGRPHLFAAIRKGLNETGYVEGQNVVIDYLSAEGQSDRLPALASELVRRRVAVIITPGRHKLLKLPPLLFRSCSASPWTPSKLASLQVSIGRPVTSLVLPRWPQRLRPSGSGSCMSFCPPRHGSLSSSTPLFLRLLN